MVFDPNTLPVGAVIPYAGPVRDDPLPGSGFPRPGLPAYILALRHQGWLPCDGRALPVAGYPELFRAIGFIYGRKGPGLFLLPDYRGRFLRGVNQSAADGETLRDPDQADRQAGADQGWSGDRVGSVQPDGLLKHWHYYDKAMPSALAGKGGPVYSQYQHTPTDPSSDQDGQPGPNQTYAARETRPKNIYVHFLIKYTQGFRPWFKAGLCCLLSRPKAPPAPINPLKRRGPCP